MAFYGPCTPSDAAEPDRFVQGQLLLANAPSTLFGVPFTDCDTIFADDLLDVGIVRARAGRVLGMICARETTTSQLTAT